MSNTFFHYETVRVIYVMVYMIDPQALDVFFHKVEFH